MFERYIKEPFKYATSDWKKIFVGGVLNIIAILPLELLSAMIGVISYSGSRFGTYTPSIEGLTTMIAIFVVLSLFTIIISIILMGYYITISKNTIESIDTLPEWENFGTFIKNGFLYYVALLIFGFVVIGLPIILMSALLFIPVYNHISNYHPNMNIIIGLLLFILVICILAILAILYIPLATVNFAKKGFEGFFEFKYILKLISLKYIVLLILLWLIFVVISALINLPAMVLSILSELSYNTTMLYISKVLYAITGGFTSFFLSVIYYRSISNYYVDKLKKLKN
ncbi:DUF4013 domain-containing protein [Methanothermococcus sp.]|uniref:DUF4013 domain-containing protein n=1 Tax=Methanothermococcus sp. TaxID=2614238 RepID=UPI0025DEDCA6|nr:DUF4013 domain-containing protein [Methanothermococcus sp.]